jgi:hypothetical protein
MTLTEALERMRMVMGVSWRTLCENGIRHRPKLRLTGRGFAAPHLVAQVLRG